MKEKTKELKELLNQEEQLQHIYKKEYDNFLLETDVIRNSISEVKNKILIVKNIIEDEAKKEFEKTGIKKLYGGIGIQERSKLSYDKTKAFEFAKQKDMFLQLDKKAFEKVAESLNLDFVKSEKNIVVTFPKEIKINE